MPLLRCHARRGDPRELELSGSVECGEPAAATPRGGWAGLVFAAGLVLAHLLAGPTAAGGARFAAGRAEARAIAAGAVWRAVTALTLHVDAVHLVANVAAGGLLVGAAGWTFGGGFALFLAVLSGTVGNVANALLRGPPHVAVGASTAVLGTVGVLAGSAAIRARRAEAPRRRRTWWVPVAAGLGLLALLGADPRSDLGAHLCGFLGGLGLGALAAAFAPQPPRGALQGAFGAAAAAGVGLAWARALGG